MTGYAAYTDKELTAFLNAGDKRAFDEIYQRYWKRYYNEAYKRLRNAEVCEEVVQNVFTDLWLKKDLTAVDNLTAYISVAIRNQVYVQYKKSSRLPVFEEPLEYMAEAYLQADSMLQLKELKQRIDDWLKLQPEKRREIFKMRFMQELSTKEISDILEISQKTVQNQLNTATASLKVNLGKALTVSVILMAMKA
ncbi:MAG: sigma-70 family RNA polymerase sigma factor [Pedobacter sp.]|nr:MAG: sigma-70 family RNA polymerase sigma factor [Pedobacter sp.]